MVPWSVEESRAMKEELEFQSQTAKALPPDRIAAAGIAIAVKTGEGGKLFGAVTANDIHEKLTAAGITIEKRRIHLGQPIKTLGKHEVKIKLHADVSVELSFDVVSENIIEPAASASTRCRSRNKVKGCVKNRVPIFFPCCRI